MLFFSMDITFYSILIYEISVNVNEWENEYMRIKETENYSVCGYWFRISNLLSSSYNRKYMLLLFTFSYIVVYVNILAISI